jgi:hypothetical protein
MRQSTQAIRAAGHAANTTAGISIRAALFSVFRHQIDVLQRSAGNRPRLTTADRVFWAWPSEVWKDWSPALVIVKPETVIGWHRNGFRLFWTWKVRRGRKGGPAVPLVFVI